MIYAPFFSIRVVPAVFTRLEKMSDYFSIRFVRAIPLCKRSILIKMCTQIGIVIDYLTLRVSYPQ